MGNPSRRQSLNKFPAGEVENDLLNRVREGDLPAVRVLFSQFGTDLLDSSYGEGVTKTCILVAACNGDLEMTTHLVRYGGKKILDVKDFKGRDTAYYAEKHGWDMRKLRSEATVDCWAASTNASDARMAVNLAKLGVASQPSSRRNSNTGTSKGGAVAVAAAPAAAPPSIRILQPSSTANDSLLSSLDEPSQTSTTPLVPETTQDSPGVSTPGYGGVGGCSSSSTSVGVDSTTVSA